MCIICDLLDYNPNNYSTSERPVKHFERSIVKANHMHLMAFEHKIKRPES